MPGAPPLRNTRESITFVIRRENGCLNNYSLTITLKSVVCSDAIRLWALPDRVNIILVILNCIPCHERLISWMRISIRRIVIFTGFRGDRFLNETKFEVYVILVLILSLRFHDNFRFVFIGNLEFS